MTPAQQSSLIAILRELEMGQDPKDALRALIHVLVDVCSVCSGIGRYHGRQCPYCGGDGIDPADGR